jgi:hypothetical protein
VLAMLQGDLEKYQSMGGTCGVSYIEELDRSERTRQEYEAVRGEWDVPHIEEADISLDSLERWIEYMGEP